MTYDPDNWLVSLTRELGSYVSAQVGTEDVAVEMSFPDTRSWKKETPLRTAIIHFEQDDAHTPVLGFDQPGVDVLDVPTDEIRRHEAVMHLVNFDVGVWVSAEMGGVTKRMELCQALTNMFATVYGKRAFNAATSGLWIESFTGGRNELDRINDVPMWRALDMTLVVKCFSRHIPADPAYLTLNAEQGPHLTIQTDGTTTPVVTP